MNEVENRMVIDEEWDEIEYGVKRKSVQERHAEAWEEEERDGCKKKNY